MSGREGERTKADARLPDPVVGGGERPASNDLPDDASVAVIITCHNYAHFLGDALDSIVAQTIRPDEIIVVDDASDDDPRAVTDRYPGVRFLSTGGGGISKARNVGLQAAASRYVAYLDADDVFVEDAIENGLRCFARHDRAGFVYGAYRLADATLKPGNKPQQFRVGINAYRSLLRENVVRMHAAVLYDREKLSAIGGFDEDVKRCEDYDVFLRMAARYPVGCHSKTVALYRLHGANTSSDVRLMLEWHREVLERHRPTGDDEGELAAWNEGRRRSGIAFSDQAWKNRGADPFKRWGERVRMFRLAPGTTSRSALKQLAIRLLPQRATDGLRKVLYWSKTPPLGEIDFGDLARLEPISHDFGLLRGTPIDRYYIDQFLTRYQGEITGDVLEVLEPLYIRKYGHDVTKADVISLSADPEATIVGDMTQDGVLASEAYDCLVFTQVLQMIYDIGLAVDQMHRALKPGGIALVTVPGITRIQPEGEGDSWNWSLTPLSARKLFEDAFGAENVEVVAFGNVFAATCFLQGLVLQDVGEHWLDTYDPSFPVTICVRAKKPA